MAGRLTLRSAGVLAAGLLASTSGCSFVAVRPGPPPRHCGVALPLLDALGATTLLGMAKASADWPIVPGCDELECYGSRGEKNGEIAALGVGAAVFAASAIYGFVASARCAPPPVPAPLVPLGAPRPDGSAAPEGAPPARDR